MRVLVTRPEHDAAGLKSRIEALGCEVVTAPLIEIQVREIAGDALDGATGLIATSRNGLRSLAASPLLDQARDLPLLAVGPATAALGRELGFKVVHDGAGTAAELIPLIIQNAHQTSRRLVQHGLTQQGLGHQGLVHLAGDHLAFDLAGQLKTQGIPIRVIEAYRSIATAFLPLPVAQLLADGKLDAVILMSPRSAKIWTKLTAALPEKQDLTRVVHICLSSAVAKSLAALQPVKVATASRPNAGEIIALVYQLARQRKTG